MSNTIKWSDDPVDQICCMWARRHGQAGTVREVAARIVENAQGQAAGRIAELEAEVARLRGAGKPMSNTCFNLSQMAETSEHRKKMLRGLVAAWDAALAQEPS